MSILTGLSYVYLQYGCPLVDVQVIVCIIKELEDDTITIKLHASCMKGCLTGLSHSKLLVCDSEKQVVADTL